MKSTDSSKQESELISLYQDVAGYSSEMDAEVNRPLYQTLLNQLSMEINTRNKPVLDSACGTGHFLKALAQKLTHKISLVGVDLSPLMIQEAKRLVGDKGQLQLGNMLEMSQFSSSSLSALVNLFAIQHITKPQLSEVFYEWNRVLEPNGILMLAGWNGTGAIDYGDETSLIAQLYTLEELTYSAEKVGFDIRLAQIFHKPSSNIPMDAFYIKALKG